jgi:hypothetical protein
MAAVAGIAAVAALAVAIPSLGHLGRDTTTPAKRTDVILPGPNDPTWSSITTWPTRGSLAGDAEFLARFQEATLDLARVIYAGDVGDDRVVLTIGHGDTGAELATIYGGERGVPASALTSTGSSESDLGRALVVREDPGPQGWMLVLAPPSLRTAEVSPTAKIHLDGTVTRQWSTATLRDGVGVLSMRDAPSALTRVRVAGYDGPAQLTAGNTAPDPDSDGFCGNCTGQEFLDHAIGGTSHGVATMLGLQTREVSTTTLFNGTIDPPALAVSGIGDTTGPGDLGRLYIGLTRLPGGQVVRTVHLGVTEPGGTGRWTTLEEAVPLDTTTAGRRPFVLYGPTADATATVYQVFAPGAASVRLVGDLPGFGDTTKTRLVDGAATFSLKETGVSEHRRVETFDGAGELTGTWPLDLPNRDDPYDVLP